MAYSNLYSAICRGKWFISFSEVDANLLLVHRLLAHDASLTNGKNLSEDTPIPFMTEAGGRLMKHSNRFADAPKDSTAVIPLHGTMLKYGTYCSYGTTEVAAIVEEATQAKNISSILLDIDSGGGSVDAIAPLIDAIHSAQSKRKAVVAYCDLCASAAYYVGQLLQRDCGRQRGVRRTGQHRGDDELHGLREVYEDKGIKQHTIYSNLSDYKNAPFEAAKKGDYKAIRDEELDPLAKDFQESVKRNRGATPAARHRGLAPRPDVLRPGSRPGWTGRPHRHAGVCRQQEPRTVGTNVYRRLYFTLNLNELCLQK